MDQAGADQCGGVQIAVVNECVDHRNRIFPVGRVYQHSGRFIDDDNVTVFINDLKRNIFGPHRCFTRRIDSDLDQIIFTQLMADVLMPPVHLTSPGFDDVTQVHLAEPTKMVKQKILKPHFLRRERYLYQQPFIHTRYCIVTQINRRFT